MKRDRADTDKSLRTERTESDIAIRDRQDAELAADRVLDLARKKADAVLEAERERADQQKERSRAAEIAVIDLCRRRADQVLSSERAEADERLRRRREEIANALAKLVPLERENTDRDLLSERIRSDEAIANRDEFLGIVCHDLRNLLGGIVITSSMLSDNATETYEGSQVKLSGKRIQVFAARMNRLIGDLLDVASLDAGTLHTHIVSDDPLTLIVETVDLFKGSARIRNITLESEVPNPLPRADFDHQRMLQVFANVVTNAIKFSPQGSKVYVRGVREDGFVHFSVSDSGVGIPESKFEDVFKRFWQADQKDRRGVGLGLYISKSIMEAHQGKIWVESTVGQGSTFHFIIPVAIAVAA